jgi:hypothetical protein
MRAVLVGVGVVCLVACGGGDEDGASVTTVAATVATSVPSTVPATTAAPTTTQPAEPSVDTIVLAEQCIAELDAESGVVLAGIRLSEAAADVCEQAAVRLRAEDFFELASQVRSAVSRFDIIGEVGGGAEFVDEVNGILIGLRRSF